MSTTRTHRVRSGIEDARVRALSEVGTYFHERGWALGTSGNFSVVAGRSPFRLLVTASGRDKRRLGASDFVLVDADARPLPGATGVPSAETALHVALARRPDVGAVLHSHSVWATVLSDVHGAAGGFELAGYEMLKGLAGIEDHAARVRVEIFENTQDIPALAAQVTARREDPARPLAYGFLMRRHGLYTWGRDLDEALRHVEILEFLFEVAGRTAGLSAIPGHSP